MYIDTLFQMYKVATGESALAGAGESMVKVENNYHIGMTALYCYFILILSKRPVNEQV